MVPEKTITISYFDYTVLLGYAVHSMAEQEGKDSIQRIVERTRRLNEKTPTPLVFCWALGIVEHQRGRCTEPGGHPPVTGPGGSLYAHHDVQADLWWNTP